MSTVNAADAHAPFSAIEEGIAEIAAGRMLIVVDDEDRENEGDLVMAAEKVTPEAVNFMARHGRGLICMPLTGERLDALGIPPMADENTSEQGTAFHCSIGAKGKITTGISAADRAVTITTAIADDATPGGHLHARPRLPAARPSRRRARACGAHRGRRRPRAPRRARRRQASSARS